MEQTTVAPNAVVGMTYTLKDDEGKVLDESKDQPLHYLHGHQNIITGLESALTGLKVGEQKEVTVSAEEAYGTHNPDLVFQIGKEQFNGQIPQVGQMVQLQVPNGDRAVAQITNVAEDHIVLDANHPLAGKNLNFEVEIVSIREANHNEINHGHPHGADGTEDHHQEESACDPDGGCC